MGLVVKGQVKGKVQGVWFRGFVTKAACARGVTGYVKNINDGSVEVLLCGDSEPVAEMKALVEKGPSQAQVEMVDWELLKDTPASIGFDLC